MAQLFDRYKNEIIPALKREFNYANIMQVPKLTKVVVNMGLGEAIQNVKLLESAQREIAAMTGQKPIITRARKSIAGFKLREGMPIGVKVTLRRERMYEFVERLCNVALPRVRDFRGVSATAFDGKGNYSLGMREQIIFPEINYDTIEKIKGLNITMVTNAATDEEASSLLRHLGMPFRK